MSRSCCRRAWEAYQSGFFTREAYLKVLQIMPPPRPEDAHLTALLADYETAQNEWNKERAREALGTGGASGGEAGIEPSQGQCTAGLAPRANAFDPSRTATPSRPSQDLRGGKDAAAGLDPDPEPTTPSPIDEEDFPF